MKQSNIHLPGQPESSSSVRHPHFALLAGFSCPLLCLVLGVTASARADGLRAGLARIDITPTQPVMMSGYASRKELSQGVHDPLSARVTAFERDGQRLVLVSTDIIGFYGAVERMRKTILEQCKLEPSELFLTSIHTHSAPTVTFDSERGHSNNVAYSKELERKLVQVINTALANLTPVQIGVGSGASPVGANRRQVVKDDSGKSKIVLGRNPFVNVDHEVQVLKLARPDSKDPLAVLFAYPSHSTSLGPSNLAISGDVHGLAEQFIEKYLGADVLAPAFAGTSGDIDPWYRVLPGFRTTNGWVPEPVLLGTLLGEEVVHVLEGIQKPAGSGPIKALFRTVLLPAKPSTNTAASATSPFNITVARVGEVAFAGLGGEVFNEIGQAIKAGSPYPCTIVMTHCNGSAGYLPTQPSYAAGGYEVQSSRFAPGAAEMVAEETKRMLAALRE